MTWRTLTYIRSENANDEKTKDYKESLDRAESHISDYLLGKNDNLGIYEQHVFPLDKIESTSHSGLPTNINRYFMRIISMDIIGNSNNLFIYTKLPAFMIIGFVKIKNPKLMRESRISLKEGSLHPRKYQWPDGFIDYIQEKCQEIKDVSNELSEKQQQVIENAISKNPSRVEKSKQTEALINDFELFGDDIFR